MARRYDAACDAGHVLGTVDVAELADWLADHNACKPPHRCVGCGRFAQVLVEDTGLCVACDVMTMAA